VFLVALACFFPAFINTVEGVRGIEDTLIQTARTFRIGWWPTLLRVTAPAAAGWQALCLTPPSRVGTRLPTDLGGGL
jgi:ABC-type nitrate/sulfonate/bicarbonate transport system permease component